MRRTAGWGEGSPRTAFRALALMSGRDMLRNRLTGFASLFVFAWMLLLYVLLSLMTGGWWLHGAESRDGDPLRSALPGVLMAGIAALALMGTTVPLVAMRERGLLRLFATTPLSRTVFLVAQLPARLAIVGAEAVAAISIAVARGFADEMHPLRLLVTLLLGTALAFAFAFLFASRSDSSEASHHGMAFLSIALLFASGGFLPAGVLPAALTTAIHALPPAWFAGALGADLAGIAPPLPVPILWALMALTATLATLIAIRRFEWDRREPRPRAPTSPRSQGRPIRPDHPNQPAWESRA